MSKRPIRATERRQPRDAWRQTRRAVASAGAVALIDATIKTDWPDCLNIDTLYGKDGYVTVVDSGANVVMHPFLPEMTGKNLAGLADGNGIHPFGEVARIGRGSGAGFVAYSYPRPGSTVEEPKIMRVRHYAAWDWNISSGVSIDDINLAFRRSLLHALAIVAAVFAAPPEGLTTRPFRDMDALTVHLFSRSGESDPLILEFMDLAAEEARRTQITLDARY